MEQRITMITDWDYELVDLCEELEYVEKVMGMFKDRRRTKLPQKLDRMLDNYTIIMSEN